MKAICIYILAKIMKIKDGSMHKKNVAIKRLITFEEESCYMAMTTYKKNSFIIGSDQLTSLKQIYILD